MFDPSTNYHLIVESYDGYGYATVCRLTANGTPEVSKIFLMQLEDGFLNFSGSSSMNSIALNTATNIFVVAHRKQSTNNGMQLKCLF